jgi:hypothetical protein
MAIAKWKAGSPTLTVDAAGTLHASIPVLDNKTLAVTLSFTLTSDHALRVDVTSAPGDAGLTAFEAWSNK